MASKAVGKVKHDAARSVDGKFNLRAFRHASGKCECGGVLVHAKVVPVIGRAKMAAVCAGRDAVLRDAWFEGDKEVSEKEKTDKAVNRPVVAIPEIPVCGAIY